MSAGRKEPESIAGDEDFIRFMQVAREDQEIHQRLVMVLSQDDFHRNSLLNTWISDLELQKAPDELRRVFTYLLDSEVAASALEFVCIVDESKVVEVLGRFPLPVEVIPMARGLVARALRDLGGHPELREGFVTDNGNLIIDVHDLRIDDPSGLENRLNNLVGAVCNGIFAAQAADVVFVAGRDGLRQL